MHLITCGIWLSEYIICVTMRSFAFSINISAKGFLIWRSHQITLSSMYWYSFPQIPSVKIDSNEGFLRSGRNPVLKVYSAGHALHVFINGRLSGERHDVRCLWFIASTSMINHFLLVHRKKLFYFLCWIGNVVQ